MNIKKRLEIIKDNPYSILCPLNRRGLLRFLPDKTHICLMYRARMGKKLDLHNPETFNEKLQWLKLYDRRPLYTKMVDKYAVREYVQEKIGGEHLVPLIGKWDKVENIDFEALPAQFVLKCNHDSGSVIICREKANFNVEEAKQKLAQSLKKGTYIYYREWPYKNIKPCIIAEQYMEDATTKELRDYKFFCFHGKVRCFKIDFNRFMYHQANYYSPEGELMPFGEIAYPSDFSREIAMPHTLKKMIEYAEKLSADIPFLRVDFYEVNEHIYFGELTFYPAAGFGRFEPEEWDEILGSWIDLPKSTNR